EVSAAAELPRGRYDLWVVGPGGESDHQPLYLDELPQTAETEPNDALAKANSAVLPGAVWGTLAARGDVDSYSFDARAGQELVVELAANSIGSKTNAVLTLYDAAGRVLAQNNDFGDGGDPLVPFAVPADGRYTIQVSDLMLNGSAAHFYRLTMGELSVATGVF